MIDERDLPRDREPALYRLGTRRMDTRFIYSNERATAVTITETRSDPGTSYWSSTVEKVMSSTVLVGPALMLVASLMISADVRRLPGELDWVSEPEGTLGVFAAVFLVSTWVVIGRRVSTAAPRAGVAITMLGVAGAVGWVYPFAYRLVVADLVDAGFDADAINEVGESGGTVFTALVLPVMFLGLLVPLIAGIAILRTRVAPVWSGLALVAFAPVFVTAQAAYVLIEVIYPIACLLLVAGVAGATRGSVDVRVQA